VFFTVLGFNSFGQNDTSRIALFVDGVKVISDYEGWRRSGPDATPYRYNDSGFLCQGEYLYFYESGALKHRGFYKNGRIEGKRYDYHENGQLKDSSTTANGRWVDSSWSYYPNGTLERMCVHLTGVVMALRLSVTMKMVKLRIMNFSILKGILDSGI
tara:strand:- start:283 stop:753 length:471 start_codon:yes stop_codon:yes gene_type:complete